MLGVRTLIRIGASSDVAIFERAVASIRSDMATGRVRPDDKLPSAREVAGSLGDILNLGARPTALGMTADALASLVRDSLKTARP